MSISIGDALLRLGVDSSELDAGLKGIKDKLNSVSMAWVGVGAALMGSMGLMVKAAQDEQVNIQRLSISLKNVGVSYNSVKDSLEGVILATQRKTGIADSQQRDALNELIMVTGDYQKSLEWLPTVLDMAAAKQMDAVSAARLLGRAAIGNTELLTRYGIVVREGADATEILATIQGKFKGAAEAAANPLNVLRTEISDLAEKIGSVLLPIVKKLVDNLVPVIDTIKKFVDMNPELVKALAAGALAIVGVTGAVVTLKAAVILLGTTVNLMFGGILIAIGAVVTGIVLLIQNWDKVISVFKRGTDEASRSFQKWADDVRRNANDMVSAVEVAVNKEMNTLRSAHNEKIKLWDKELEIQLEAIDEATKARLGETNTEIEAINKEIEKRRQAREDEEDERRIADLRNRILNTRSVWERAKLQEELNDYLEQMDDRRWEREQRDRQDVLRAEMEDLRESAETQKETLQNEHETRKTLAEAALENEIAIYQKSLDAFKAMNQGKLENLTEFVNEYNRIMGGLGGEKVEVKAAPVYRNVAGQLIPPPPSFQGYEGIIPGPVGKPYLATVHGGETLIQQPSSQESIIDAIRQGLAGMTIMVEVGGEQVAAVISRQQYRMKQVRV